MTHIELLKFAQSLLAENIELRKMVAAEREACAEVCDKFDICDPKCIADAIRARGQNERR